MNVETMKCPSRELHKKIKQERRLKLLNVQAGNYTRDTAGMNVETILNVQVGNYTRNTAGMNVETTLDVQVGNCTRNTARMNVETIKCPSRELHKKYSRNEC